MDETLQVFEQVAQYFGLLADPRHLNILYRAGVVERRRDGSSVYYRVVDPNFVDICRTVSITVASRDLGDELGVGK